MTQGVLDFAPLSAEPAGVTDVAAHLGQVAGVMVRLLGDRLTLELDVGDGIQPARMAPGALTQVLLNLATTVRDAMPQGGSFRISVSERAIAAGAPGRGTLPAARHVRIVLAARGAGMDLEAASRALRASLTTTGGEVSAEGVGPGLANVFLIVHRAGGQISLDTVPGEGATFTVDLPVAVPDRGPVRA